MRVPNTAHTSQLWRIHELTHDFRLEDVWALPGAGGPDDFPRLVQRIASYDPSQSSSCASEVKGSASKSGPRGPSRRSTGNRSRSVGTLEPTPVSGPSQPSSSPIFHRIAKSVRTAQEELCDGSYEATRCTSRGKSSGPPAPGSAHRSEEH